MSKKYYKIKLNSLQNTFSKVDAGSNVYFEIQNSSESLDSIQLEEEDVVLATQSDEIFYSFSVSNQNDTRVQLHKSFEIEKSFDSNIDKEGVMLEIDEVEYNSICTSLFTDYNNGEVPLIARTHLDNLKEEFAAWLFQLGKYSRVYKKDRTILIEKLEEYENAYEIDFGIKIFDSQNISIETIIEELESNIIDDSGKIGDLNRKTVGNGSVKAILGTNNYIKFLKEKITKEKISSSNSPRVKGINKIYFGAPGTGKSFQITEDLKEVDNVFQERVTFHPEYDNASFVGGYKPITDKNGDIKYEFVSDKVILIKVQRFEATEKKKKKP